MSQPLEPQRTDEDWRTFVADHLKRQTSAIEAVRGMLVFFTVLAVLAIVFQILLVAGA